MAILITPDILSRSAERFIESRIDEQADTAGAPGEEAHIYNLYEEFSMPLSDIVEIGRLGLEGKLENVQEKMDGQFLAFTVIDGQLKFFTKMDLQGQSAKRKKLEAIKSRSKGGGMTLDEIMMTYTGSRSNIAEGFAIAYRALEPIVLQYESSLFRNGEVVIASQIMVSKNPNTILYDKDSLRTVLAISLTGDPVNEDALSSFRSEMKDASTDAFTMDEVPTAKLMKGLEVDDSEIKKIEKDLESVAEEAGITVGNSTVGDYIKARLEGFIREKYKFIPEPLVPDVADRFMTGRGKVSLRLKKVVSADDYQKFRDLDKVKSRVVQEAIIPLENIIQRLGIMIIDKLDLALDASNQDDLLVFVKDVRSAFNSGFDFGLGEQDTKTLEGIRVALARLEANEDLFKRATEGIVFTYKGKTYKLTGLFTPINRLRGFFGEAMGRESFGKAQLRKSSDLNGSEMYSGQMSEMIFRAYSKMILEGGNAFKDLEGNRITRLDRMPREIVSGIVETFSRDVLDKLGVKSVGVGTTVSTSETAGDLDFVIEAQSAQEVYNLLSELPELQEELSQAPGINRLYKLPGGSGVAVLYYAPTIDELVQVDVMPSAMAPLDDVSWMLAGADAGGVKSRYRNILMAFIARELGKKESSETGMNVKYTYARGLQKKVDGQPVGFRETDPDSFLPILKINAPKQSVRSFEQIVDYMRSDPWLSTILPDFRAYIDNRQHLQSKDDQRRKESEMAASYIDDNSFERDEDNISEMIRKMVQRILVESNAEAHQSEEIAEEVAVPTALQSVSLGWLRKNSVDNPLYDRSSNTFHSQGIDALIDAFVESTGRTDGHKFEEAMEAYAKSLTPPIPIVAIEGGTEEGMDLRNTSTGVTYELKKSEINSANLMLNATFPKPGLDSSGKPAHYYIFVTNLPKVGEIKRTLKLMKAFEGGAITRDDVMTTLSKLEEEQRALKDIRSNAMFFGGRSKRAEPPADIDNISLDDLSRVANEKGTLYSGIIYQGEEYTSAARFDRKIRDVNRDVKRYESLAKKLLSQTKVYIVSSLDLRLMILESAFPGGKDRIFDTKTGEIKGKEGAKEIVDAIASKLKSFGLEYKLAQKIAPEAVSQIVSEIPKTDMFESGFDFKLGLLKIRLRIGIEPVTSTSDDMADIIGDENLGE